MNILTGGALAQWQAEQIDRLPENLLSYVSRAGSVSLIQASSVASRFACDALDRNDLEARVESTFEWFEQHGDVYQTSNGRWRAFPTYCVVTERSLNTAKDAVVPILGGNLGGRRLEQLVEDLGGVLIENLVHGGIAGTVGYERSILLPCDLLDRLEQISGIFGLTVLQMSALAEVLPSVDDLEVPPDSLFTTSYLPSPIENYAPTSKRKLQSDRWVLSNNGSAGYLVRTVGSSTRERKWRYFLQKDGIYTEVERDTAMLWQYRLDFEAKNPVAACFQPSTRRLYLDNPIPREIYRLLRICSSAVDQRDHYKRIYALDQDEDKVRDILVSRLHVQWTEVESPDV